MGFGPFNIEVLEEHLPVLGRAFFFLGRTSGLRKHFGLREEYGQVHHSKLSQVRVQSAFIAAGTFFCGLYGTGQQQVRLNCKGFLQVRPARMAKDSFAEERADFFSIYCCPLKN